MYCCTLPDCFSLVNCTTYIHAQIFAPSNSPVELALAANVVLSGKVCPLKTHAAAIQGGCLN